MSVGGDIQNYFDPDKPECIRNGYGNMHWAAFDSRDGVVRFGLVTGTTATSPNVFPVLDLRTMTWSFDDYSASWPMNHVFETESRAYETWHYNFQTTQLACMKNGLFLLNDWVYDRYTAHDRETYGTKITGQARIELNDGGNLLQVKEAILRGRCNRNYTVERILYENGWSADDYIAATSSAYSGQTTDRSFECFTGTNVVIPGDPAAATFQVETYPELGKVGIEITSYCLYTLRENPQEVCGSNRSYEVGYDDYHVAEIHALRVETGNKVEMNISDSVPQHFRRMNEDFFSIVDSVGSYNGETDYYSSSSFEFESNQRSGVYLQLTDTYRGIFRDDGGGSSDSQNCIDGFIFLTDIGDASDYEVDVWMKATDIDVRQVVFSGAPVSSILDVKSGRNFFKVSLPFLTYDIYNAAVPAWPVGYSQIYMGFVTNYQIRIRRKSDSTQFVLQDLRFTGPGIYITRNIIGFDISTTSASSVSSALCSLYGGTAAATGRNRKVHLFYSVARPGDSGVFGTDYISVACEFWGRVWREDPEWDVDWYYPVGPTSYADSVSTEIVDGQANEVELNEDAIAFLVENLQASGVEIVYFIVCSEQDAQQLFNYEYEWWGESALYDSDLDTFRGVEFYVPDPYTPSGWEWLEDGDGVDYSLSTVTMASSSLSVTAPEPIEAPREIWRERILEETQKCESFSLLFKWYIDETPTDYEEKGYTFDNMILYDMIMHLTSESNIETTRPLTGTLEFTVDPS
jgi:hypothetical protein